MGRAIFYCVQCSKRISDTDLETGKAFRIGDRMLCRACAPDSAKTASSKKIPAPGSSSRNKNSGTGVGLKRVVAPLATPPAEPAPDRRKLYLIGGGAGVALLIAIVLVVVLRNRP